MSRTKFANRRLVLVLLPACLLVGALSVSAQTTSGAIKGVVVGPDEGAVVGAHVTVVLSDNNQNPRTASSSETGEYGLNDLAPGVYNVTVEVAGFKTVIAEGIEVHAGDTQELRFTLEPGDPQNVIHIAPEPPPPPVTH